jgi:hypothetical protein
MSSIDLSSAYLQVELLEKSRKYTAFLFDSTVYQYKPVPCGFKNSLSAFVRALKVALVHSGTFSNVRRAPDSP